MGGIGGKGSPLTLAKHLAARKGSWDRAKAGRRARGEMASALDVAHARRREMEAIVTYRGLAFPPKASTRKRRQFANLEAGLLYV